MKTTKLLIILCVFLATFLVGGISQADDSGIFDGVSSDSALEAPKLTITGTTVLLSWTTVAGATGYTLYYSLPPYTEIKNIPMKTKTSYSGSLSDGDALYVAVQANNSVGSSGYSNIEYINIGNTIYGGCTCKGTLTGSRWCDNGDGTVTDLTTCLVWLKDASWGQTYALWVRVPQWTNAHDRAAQLKNGVGGLTDGSIVGDWGLPTKTMLEGLANGTEPVRFESMRAFTGVQWKMYWTSTADVHDNRRALCMHPHTGGIYAKGKECQFNVWPVRAGQ